MITAIVGYFRESWFTNPMGNGKTMTMTYYLAGDKDDGREVITNYYTTFSEQMTVQEMVEFIMNTDMKNISLGIDEMQLIFNSMGTKKSKAELITTMITQTRKRRVDIYFTTQRWKLINKTLRDLTAYVLLPYKIHPGGEPCDLDSCPRQDHEIVVMSIDPPIPYPRVIINASKIGQFYNSDEIIKEKFV